MCDLQEGSVNATVGARVSFADTDTDGNPVTSSGVIVQVDQSGVNALVARDTGGDVWCATRNLKEA